MTITETREGDVIITNAAGRILLDADEVFEVRDWMIEHA